MYEIAEEISQHLKVTRKTKNNTTHIKIDEVAEKSPQQQLKVTRQ
jgi:phenylpyruvate tautomerase PptA (4-oxalocrotonate tautomerase family)